jgi:hypothetical protein
LKLKNTYSIVIIHLLLLLPQAIIAQKKIYTDVLVIGGGSSGTTAGIQSARMAVNTIIAEPTAWLGGMITAAGVSAFDGNHNMPSGIWAEFREEIYKVYGGPSKVATGWVSNTLFEPHVGDSILKNFAAKLSNLKVLYHYRFIKTIVKGKQITGAVFYNETEKLTTSIYAKQVIDATELGDVMASANIPFDLGMEANSSTGENVNVPTTNDIIQDLTYVAILKDYGTKADCTLVKPANYNPMEFDCCCNEFCSQPSKLTSNVDAKKMLEYGKLPNGKYMINWPGKGNDIYLNIIKLNDEQRQQELKKAKAKTIRFLYFLQTQFGFKNLALANDEFPSADRLALVPYHREGRRLQGVVRFKVQHIAEPFKNSNLYRTGISVGDYPIDHHHRENLNAPQHLGFYPVPSFNIPLGALIPQQHDGIVVTEKGISVSNVVNGTTRLQPVVMMTGQAAGMLAALSVKNKKQPRQISVRQLQTQLLQSGAYIMPYYDVKPNHSHFISIQKIGATGILKGKGEPYKWANRTWFYPDTTINSDTLIKDIEPFVKINYSLPNPLTIQSAIEIIRLMIAADGKTKALNKNFDEFIETKWKENKLINFNKARNITRAEFAVLLDKIADPFGIKEVNHFGNYKTTNKN